jgi:hypothetical protein
MFLRVLFILTLCASLVCGAGSPSPSPSPPLSPGAPPPPTEASIKQLLDAAQTRKLVDSVMKQMDLLMLQAIAQATKGQPVSEKMQNDIDRRRNEMISLMKELLDWKKLEPIYVRIYQKSFTQAEVDGMIAFYKTPAGQAMVNKMPAVMQNSIDEVQQLMGPVMEKIQQTQQDVAAALKSDSKAKGGK